MTDFNWFLNIGRCSKSLSRIRYESTCDVRAKISIGALRQQNQTCIEQIKMVTRFKLPNWDEESCEIAINWRG